jgi:hypothetical protein
MAAMLTGCENYNAPYSSSSSTCCSYQKDKQAMPGSLPKKNALSKIEEQRMEKYSHFFFSPGVLSTMQETEIGSTMKNCV